MKDFGQKSVLAAACLKIECWKYPENGELCPQRKAAAPKDPGAAGGTCAGVTDLYMHQLGPGNKRKGYRRAG